MKLYKKEVYEDINELDLRIEELEELNIDYEVEVTSYFNYFELERHNTYILKIKGDF